jgi:hypothetical protein
MSAADLAKGLGIARRFLMAMRVHRSWAGRSTTLSLRDGEAGHGIDTKRCSDGKPRSESAKRVNGQNSGGRAGAGVGSDTVK